MRHARSTALCLGILTLAIAALGASGTVATAAPAPAAAVSSPAMVDPGTAEADFTNRINALRASRGLGALSTDPELTQQARIWAQNMANAGKIFHTSNLSSGISANWAKLGENVGVGAEVGVLFQAFVDSPTHLENLVDPRYTSVGVGVVISGNRMFTAHRFMAVQQDAPSPPPAPAPTAPPATAAPTTTAAPITVPPTVPPTTAAPTTTTTAPPPPPKLGPIGRISEVVAASS